MRSRTVLGLLIAANVVAFLWWHGEFASWTGSSREPDRLRQQVDADRLKVLPTPGRAMQGGGPAAPGVPAASGTSGTPTASGAPVASGPAAAGPVESCVETGPLEETRSARVRRFLTETPLVRGEIEPLGDAGVWMVYTPPSETLAVAQRRAADLRRLGVRDLYLMPDGPYRLGISFGLFRSEEGARALMDSLTQQGVRGLRVVLRGANEPRFSFRLYLAAGDSPQARELAQRLAALQTELGVNPLPCAAARSGATQ